MVCVGARYVWLWCRHLPPHLTPKCRRSLKKRRINGNGNPQQQKTKHNPNLNRNAIGTYISGCHYPCFTCNSSTASTALPHGFIYTSFIVGF